MKEKEFLKTKEKERKQTAASPPSKERAKIQEEGLNEENGPCSVLASGVSAGFPSQVHPGQMGDEPCP